MSLPNLPAYFGDVKLWFAQLDAYFSTRAVPHQQQLNILYSEMPAPLARSVKYLITDPHPDATYSSVKSEVLRQNTQSMESKFRTLMQDEHLGDRTPSEFLCRLCKLSDTSCEDNPLLRKLFFFRLPPNVQSIHATMVDSNLLDHGGQDHRVHCAAHTSPYLFRPRSSFLYYHKVFSLVT
ncbi:Hypothetical predicted protein [Octopus vulgaris]|uniref:DUF7041 domain-containing protein n=1 Tax=Octopus vulgaris TaxID=6645 RepID=A0AA36BA01_OCTVU|nr:Hypothetical predicted protein [Octopus vulgaris]